VAGESSAESGRAGRLAHEVAALQASMLARLREELGEDPAAFAAAAQRFATDFGAVTATAVDAASGSPVGAPPPPRAAAARRDVAAPEPASEPATPSSNGSTEAEERRQLASLYRPGHMRRRLEQLVETNRRYGHPFGLAVFDASGPGTRDGDAGGGRATVLAVLGAALRDSVRIVDEAFRLEEDAICVLAPNQRTVEGVQMAERLLGCLDELERAGGLRIAVSAGVVACPEHGSDAEELLRKADEAMWRARAVGQPVGVGSLQDR
jgi:diguanylate cyclase (GGDEF)-like protein